MQSALAGFWSGDQVLSPARAIGKARTPWPAAEERVTVNGKVTFVPAKCALLNHRELMSRFLQEP